MAEADRAIKAFLYPRMYRHPRIAASWARPRAVVCDLFERYAESPRTCRRNGRKAADRGTRRRGRAGSPISSPA